MGLFGDMLKDVRMQDPIRGHAQVVSCSAHRGDAAWQNCRLHLVVHAPGLPATSVEETGLVRADRWPVPGMTLPVTVDRANPRKVKVEWDEVETSKDRARRNADAIAAAMRAEGDASGGLPIGGANAHVVNVSGRHLSELSDEQRTKLQMLGIDPSMLGAHQGPTAPPDAGPAPAPRVGAAPPSGVPGEQPPPPPGAPMGPNPGAGADDQLARLERLGALRQQGVLTEAEFEQQKKRILDR